MTKISSWELATLINVGEITSHVYTLQMSQPVFQWCRALAEVRKGELS